MAQFRIPFKTDLAKRLYIQRGGNLVFNADDLSNIVAVEVYNNGEPVTLAGTVVGAVIRPDGTTVPIANGTFSGNTAQITLTKACFTQIGQIGVGIQIVNGGVATTVLKVLYTAERFDTSNVVDPDSEVTLHVGELIDDIETAIASIPSSYTDLMAAVAPTFSTSTAYTAGQYVWYDGKLYRFTTDHAAGSWNVVQVELAVVANDLVENVSDLKSQLNETDKTVDGITNVVYSKNRLNPEGNITRGYYLGSNGELMASPNWNITDYCYVEGFSNVYCWEKTSGYANTMPFACAYDSDKNFKSYLGSASTFEIPSDVSYIRFCFGNSITLANIMLESGTSKTSFVPYSKAVYINTDDITSIDNVKDAVSYKVVALEMTSGKLLDGNTGAITDITNDSYRVSQYVEVSEDTDYLITTEHFWSNGLYVWYDSNKNYISGVPSQTGGTITKIYCQKVRSPKNAAYLVIGYLYQVNFPFPFLMEGEKNSIMPSKRWSGKKWTCIGDSLTEAYTVTGAHYFDLISAATGIETVNKGVSGTGYAKGTDNFMTRALTVPTDSDVVTFFGSGNDSGAGLPLGTASDTGTETLGGCINTAIDNLYSIMPVVQLGIVTPTPWQGNMPYDNGWMANYSALIVEICNRRSIPCLDLFHCSNLDPNSEDVRETAYARDNGGGVHPNEIGHAIIAPRFLSFLESLLMH